MPTSHNRSDASIFQTLYNIRDLGGHKTQSGQQTQYKRFLRSDAPVRLNAHDLELLLAYPVSQVIDLRSPSEIRQKPHELSSHPSIHYSNISLLGADLDANMNQLEALYAQKKSRQPELVDLYRHMLDHAQHEIGCVMRSLASDQPGTRLFHCSHGKDRTGLIAALLLLLADVPKPVIIHDYEISESLLQPWFQHIMQHIPAAHQRYLSTPAVYMEKTLEHLFSQYGTLSDYLLNCGVSQQTQDRLRQLLLNENA